MKIVFITGPSASGKTNYIISEMTKFHKVDPLSYLFVGPGGDYIKQIREAFLAKTETKTIVATKFLALDQFAVSVLRLFRPEMLHIGNDILRMEIRNILEELGKKEFSHSSALIEYLLDMIHDVKENEGFDTLFGEDDEMILLMKSVYLRLEEKLKSKRIFDTFDAYIYSKELADEIRPGEFGSHLFLDGFHDFTPAMKTFIKAIAGSFDTVYITAVDDPSRTELFSETRSIFDFVDELTIENELHRIYLKETYHPEGVRNFFKNIFASRKENSICPSIKIKEYSDKFNEVEGTAREIKRLLSNGFSPDEISVVASDFSIYDKLMSEKFKDYGIPFRSEGDEPLTNSRAVKALLLPLETAVSHFPPEKLIAMGDAGYAGKDLDARYFESVTISARLIYDFPRTSFNSRKKRWNEKIEKYKLFLQKKLNAVATSPDDEFEEADLSVYKEALERVKNEVEPALSNIFKTLEIFKGVKRKDCRLYGKLFELWEAQIGIHKNYNQLKERFSTERELLAIDTFFQKVIPELERLLIFLDKEFVSPEEYYSYLNLMVRNRKFKTSKAVANRVEIQSLLNSRFSFKKIKFFLGFNDENYPAVKLNPLYSFTQFSEKTPKDLLLTKEKQQKLNLYLAITRVSEQIIFSYPSATLDGETLLPSPYLKDILKSSGSMVESLGNNDGRKGGIIPEIEKAMSKDELKLSMAKYYDTEYWPELIKEYGDYGLSKLSRNLNRFSRPFSWKINKAELIEKRIGRTFSFSRFKVYDDCPFKFYLSYLLKLKEKEEILFEINPMEEGTIYHSVLKDYFSGFELEWEKALERNLKKYIKHDSQVIFNFEYKRLLEVLKEYIEVREASVPKYMGAGLKPSFFEIPFGMENPKQVEIVDNVYLRGKIDRIDIDDETGEMYIIDYKRGVTSDKKQLVLYSIAANNLFRKEQFYVRGGTFRPLTGKKMSASSFKTEELDGESVWKFFKSQEITRSTLDFWVKNLTDSLFNGDFTPTVERGKDNCFFCKFKRICSVSRWRNTGVDRNE